jgi:hypothetical protein
MVGEGGDGGGERAVGEGGGLEGAGEDGVDYKRGVLWWPLGEIKGVCVRNKEGSDDETKYSQPRNAECEKVSSLTVEREKGRMRGGREHDDIHTNQRSRERESRKHVRDNAQKKKTERKEAKEGGGKGGREQGREKGKSPRRVSHTTLATHTYA